MTLVCCSLKGLGDILLGTSFLWAIMKKLLIIKRYSSNIVDVSVKFNPILY
jgi:hypothetical protein